MKRNYQDASGGTNMPLVTTEDRDPGEDELLSLAGYSVRASDLDEVARKLDQLDMMMRFGCSSSLSDSSLDFEFLSHLESDTVHYDPSDISNWLQSLISEANYDKPTQPNPINTTFINNPVDVFPTSSDHHHTLVYDEPTSSSYDLSAIPGQAICGERENKRLKQQDSPPPDFTAASPPLPIVIPVPDDDSQQNGIRLVHTLMACAHAVQQQNLKLAWSLHTQIGLLAASQAGPMRKVATYFAQALARRIYPSHHQPSFDSSFSDILQIHFYETCPQLRFAHFTANQAILEAVAESSRVHVIDFSMRQGMQWPALMQALAMRPNGPPTLRLTGIGPPQPDNTDALQQVGWKLAQFAENLQIKFVYKGFVAHSLADLDASMFGIQPGETVVVNSVFELHQLLARPGGVEKVFSSLEQIKPKIVTIVEQEANHNGSVFVDRFTESLHYYSALFDSLEGTSITNGEDLLMSEIYFGNQISNIVACEGVDRVERHEYLTQWKKRLESAGFAPSPLGSNTFQQVSSLLTMLGGGSDSDAGGGYTVAENDGCLFLGWHTRPLVSSSAWKLK